MSRLESDVFANAGNPLLERPPSLSLFDVKLAKIQSKGVEKQRKLTPPPSPSLADMLKDYTHPGNPDRLTNLAKLAESDTRSSIENIGNFVTGQNNPNAQAEADIAAGLNPNVRQQLGETTSGAIDSLALGNVNFGNNEFLDAAKNYGSAIFDTLSVAPELAADSAGSLLEGAVGVAATALPEAASSVAGLGVLGRRAAKISKGFKGIKKSIAEAEAKIRAGTKTTVLDKAVLATAKTAKATSQTSVMTASILQEMKEDFIVENNGKEPTGAWYAVNAPIAIALNTVQLGIFKKLYLPSPGKKLSKAVKDLKPNSKLSADRKAITEYTKEIIAKLDPIPKGWARKVAGRVFGGFKDVVKAGGAEAAQEYFQTWHEILSTKMDVEDLDFAIGELSKADKQAEAMFGGLAGAAAGGAIKTGIAVPGVAAGVALDTTVKAAKLTGNVVKAATILAAESTAKKTVKLLSNAETAQQKVEHEAATVVHEELEKANNSKLAIIQNKKQVKTFEDITDEDIRADFDEIARTDDLSDPRTFIKVRETAIRQYKADIVASKGLLESRRIGKVAAAETRRVIRNVGKLIRVTPEDIDRVVRIGKIVGKKAIKELKNFNTSTTFGLAEKAIDFGTNTSKESFAALQDIARENSPEIIRKLADTLNEDMPKVAKQLRKMADEREFAITEHAGNQDKLINRKGLGKTVKDVFSRKFIPKNAAAVGLQILEDSKRIPEDLETVETLQGALEIYKADKLFKEQGRGALSPEVVEDIEKKLAEEHEKHKSTVAERAADLAKTAATASDTAVAFALDNVGPAVKTIAKALDTVAAALISDKGKGSKTDTEIKGPTKTAFKVKLSEASKAFLIQMNDQVKQIAALEGDDKTDADAKLKHLLSSAALIQKLSEEFETTDTDAIIAILHHIYPEISSVKDLNKTIETALVGVDTVTAPAIVTRVVKDTPEGTIELDEDGHWLVNAAIQEEVTEFIGKEVLGKDNICK